MHSTPRHRVASILVMVLLLAPLASSLAVPAAAQQSQPQGQSPSAQSPSSGSSAPDVQVSHETKTTTWYASPTWIIIGVVVLGLIVVLFALGRSRTTVIKQ